MLNLIQCPFKNDQHALKTYNGEFRDTGIRTWYDKYNIRYFYNEEETTLYIRNLQHYLEKNEYESFIKHLENLPEDTTIVFNNLTKEEFNSLVDLLNNGNIVNKVYLCLKTNEKITKHDHLNMEGLPKNVYVSAYDIPSKKEGEISWYNEDLIVNFLNRSNYEMFEILKRLDLKTRKKLIEMERIVKSFYEEHKDTLDSMDDLSKADFVYEWCKNNISQYEGLGDEKHSFQHYKNLDAVETFRNKVGTNHGINRLMTALLNNKYLNVDCKINKEEDTLLSFNDEWVDVDDGKNSIYCYDVTGQQKRVKEEDFHANLIKKNNATSTSKKQDSKSKPDRIVVKPRKKVVKNIKHINVKALKDTSFHIGKESMTSTMRIDYIGAKDETHSKDQEIEEENIVDTSFHMGKDNMTSTMRIDYIGVKDETHSKDQEIEENIVDTSFHMGKSNMTSTMRIDYIGKEKVKVKSK